MGEIIYLSRERIQITVYMRSDGPGRRRSQCHHECDLTLVLVNGLVKELGQWYFDVRTRSWPSHVLETLVRGGWRAPVVMVGHSVVSQACVPDRAWLRTYLKEQVHILRPRLAKSS